VTITVRDDGGAPVAGATVGGAWSDGATGADSCVTGAGGQCAVSKTNLKGNVVSVTFTVNNITLAGSTYNAGANHDPNGDSDGTAIQINKDGTTSDPGSPTPTPTSTSTPTPGPTSTPTPTPEPGAPMHVGDLDATTSTSNGGKWNATVTITVHDSGDLPLANATVNGSWSAGANGSGSCVTNGSGQCAITKNNINKNSSSATFSVTDVTASSYTYIAGDNHDPDGDSNGTAIIVTKP